MSEKETTQAIDTTPKFTPVDKVYELVTVKGLSYTEAGKILGISTEAVRQLCIRNKIPSQKSLKRFKERKADLLAGEQMALLSSIEPEDIKKMTPHQRYISFAVLYDKERLERDQSTANLAIQHVEAIKTVEEADAEIARITGVETGQGLVEESAELKKLEDEISAIRQRSI